MLSVVILNYKRPALLRLSLGSLKAVLGSEFNYEIIVVDSRSTPETRSVVLDEFPGIRLLPFSKNLGYTKGINEGLRASSGEYILVLNPDVIPTKGSIESLVAYLKNNEKVGMVGPQLLNFDGSPQASCFRFFRPITLLYRRSILGKFPSGKKCLKDFLMEDANLTKTIPVDWLMGSAVMVSRKAIEKVGLMDEHFFHYMSDVDWPRRFWERGFSIIFLPEAKMYHYHQRSSKGKLSIFDPLFVRETRWHLRDAIRYFNKYGFTIPRYGV